MKIINQTKFSDLLLFKNKSNNTNNNEYESFQYEEEEFEEEDYHYEDLE